MSDFHIVQWNGLICRQTFRRFYNLFISYIGYTIEAAGASQTESNSFSSTANHNFVFELKICFSSEINVFRIISLFYWYKIVEMCFQWRGLSYAENDVLFRLVVIDFVLAALEYNFCHSNVIQLGWGFQNRSYLIGVFLGIILGLLFHIFNYKRQVFGSSDAGFHLAVNTGKTCGDIVQ